MKGFGSLRHNELSGQAYKSVSNGGLGASVMVQDIGRHNAADTPEEQEKLGTRIGKSLRALHQLTPTEQRQFDNYRPDIFIQQPDGTTFHIVEIKCCRDTDPGPQHERALAQHQDLIAALRTLFGVQHITVHMHVVLIGVTGTIYKDFHDTMALLGVSKQEAKRCAARMHKTSVQYVEKIMTTKWQQERLKHGVG